MEHIRVGLAEERAPGAIRRVARFDDTELWWEMEGPEAAMPPPLDRHDVAATALIFKAMESGRDLHIEGPVSRSLLAGLEELMVSWSLWRPDLYTRVGISAAVECDDGERPAGKAARAVAACSGGVDGSFTIWRHVTGQAGRSNRTPGLAVFVHGLDIPLANEAQFEEAFAHAAQALASIDLPLVKMRTNWRQAASRVWQMEFGAGLSSCLRHWQGACDAALIGADEDYAHLVLPWGSNPITFSMLSSPDFAVVYDGAGYGRTDKVRAIGEWPECLTNLRVCWQNASATANCGRCEKCLRTKLNFMAAGLALPPSLPGEPGLAQVLALRACNAVQVGYLHDIVSTARRNGAMPGKMRALQVSIAWNSALNGAKQVKKALFPRRRGPVRAPQPAPVPKLTSDAA